MNFKQFRKTFRNRYRAHGGYDWAWVLSDGELLCRDCGDENLRSMLASLVNNFSDGWKPEAFVPMEASETDEYCAHCNKLLNEAINDPR